MRLLKNETIQKKQNRAMEFTQRLVEEDAINHYFNFMDAVLLVLVIAVRVYFSSIGKRTALISN